MTDGALFAKPLENTCQSDITSNYILLVERRIVVAMADKYPLMVATAFPESNNDARKSQSSGVVQWRGSTWYCLHHSYHALHRDLVTAIVPSVLALSKCAIDEGR